MQDDIIESAAHGLAPMISILYHKRRILYRFLQADTRCAILRGHAFCRVGRRTYGLLRTGLRRSHFIWRTV